MCVPAESHEIPAIHAEHGALSAPFLLLPQRLSFAAEHVHDRCRMPSLDELRDTLEARMEELLERVRTLEVPPRSTIVPPGGADSAGRRAVDALAALAATPGRGLEIHRTLGEGGMGIVRLATQRALGREVAVKTLKDSAKSDAATLKLLREAWVTGQLEHPNVVPVYDIGLDADGLPQIVLKKIEGSAWCELMHDAAAVHERFDARDLFRWNLEILAAVCNAIQFAHARGILHRDLKPENVMVGRFGEVYVVDWGIAVALADDGSGRLPLAKDATDMAGTPCYMAPEMLGGPRSHLSERTDVYLLGAILYEIAVGTPPHEAPTLMEMVHRVAESAPRFPEHLPPELTRILARALAPSPDDRFESVEALHRAIEGFLEHRGSLQLTAEAEARLAEMSGERSSIELDPEDRRVRLYHLFGECRFGFLQALKQWPENVDARVGLERATELMIDIELETGDPKSAALHLAELTRPPPALVARVDEARRAYEEELARAEHLRRDNDPAIGRRTRAFLALVLGVTWTIGPLLMLFVESRFEETRTHWTMMTFFLAFMVIDGGLALWARDSLSRTAINRRITMLVGVTLAAQVLLYSGAMILGIPLLTTHTLLMFLWGVSAAAHAITIEERLWPAALGFFTAFLVASFFPETVFHCMSAGNLVLTITTLRAWSRMGEDVIEPLARRREERRERWQRFLERTRDRRTVR